MNFAVLVSKELFRNCGQDLTLLLHRILRKKIKLVFTNLYFTKKHNLQRQSTVVLHLYISEFKI